MKGTTFWRQNLAIKKGTVFWGAQGEFYQASPVSVTKEGEPELQTSKPTLWSWCTCRCSLLSLEMAFSFADYQPKIIPALWILNASCYMPYFLNVNEQTGILILRLRLMHISSGFTTMQWVPSQNPENISFQTATELQNWPREIGIVNATWSKHSGFLSLALQPKEHLLGPCAHGLYSFHILSSGNPWRASESYIHFFLANRSHSKSKSPSS